MDAIVVNPYQPIAISLATVGASRVQRNKIGLAVIGVVVHG
jgi:hypothetical protein